MIKRKPIKRCIEIITYSLLSFFCQLDKSAVSAKSTNNASVEKGNAVIINDNEGIVAVHQYFYEKNTDTIKNESALKNSKRIDDVLEGTRQICEELKMKREILSKYLTGQQMDLMYSLIGDLEKQVVERKNIRTIREILRELEGLMMNIPQEAGVSWIRSLTSDYIDDLEKSSREE